MQSFIRELWELDKPTVAAVNGAAVGPGAHLALACDFVLVHERTRFLWSFAKWGLVVDAGGAYLLPRLVGLPRAKAMVMLGEGATGEEAVDARARLPVRSGSRARRRRRAARGAARRGPDALARPLEAAAQRVASRPTSRTASTSRASFQSLAATSSDLAEGMAAFRDRRDPKFTGDLTAHVGSDVHVRSLVAAPQRPEEAEESGWVCSTARSRSSRVPGAASGAKRRCCSQRRAPRSW